MITKDNSTRAKILNERRGHEANIRMLPPSLRACDDMIKKEKEKDCSSEVQLDKGPVN